MNDQEKCEFLMKLLNEYKFKLDVRGASALLASYKWLFELNEKMLEAKKQSLKPKPQAKKKVVKKKTGMK